MQVRKTKRASNTPTAAAALEREAGKAGLTVAEAVKLCTENSWQGFRASYVRERGPRQAAPAPGMVNTFDYMLKAEADLKRLQAEREAREREEARITTKEPEYEYCENEGGLFGW